MPIWFLILVFATSLSSRENLIKIPPQLSELCSSQTHKLESTQRTQTSVRAEHCLELQERMLKLVLQFLDPDGHGSQTNKEII